MKKRILSAIVGISLGVAVLFFYETVFFTFVLSAISIMTIYEILIATKYSKNLPLSAVSLIFAGLVPFFNPFTLTVKIIVFLFVLSLFVIMLVYYRSVKLEQIGLVFFISTVIPISYTCLSLIKDNYGILSMFYVVAILVSAWTGDSGAYFVGMLIGKKPLAPNISPKKTVEGAIGGVVAAAISTVIWGYLYVFYHDIRGTTIKANLLYLIIIGIVGAIIGMLGDLFASLIKRQCAVKDFGSILPGHGGIYDRFDSIIFVAPVLYLLMQIINPLQLISLAS